MKSAVHSRSSVSAVLRAEIKESFLMAMSALAAHKLRSALTLLGVLVGVFSIIVGGGLARSGNPGYNHVVRHREGQERSSRVVRLNGRSRLASKSDARLDVLTATGSTLRPEVFKSWPNACETSAPVRQGKG